MVSISCVVVFLLHHWYRCAVSMSVCLSVCLYACSLAYLKTGFQISPNIIQKPYSRHTKHFMHVVFGYVLVLFWQCWWHHYVLPALLMMLCLHTIMALWQP